jgi:hypothetical protein
MTLPCTRPINGSIKHKFLNVESNIKDNMLWTFFFHIYIYIYIYITPQFFFMFKAKTTN